MHDWIEGAAMSVESCGHGNSHPGRWQVRHLPFSQVDKQRCFIPSSLLPSTKTTRKNQESTSSSSIGIGSVRACSSLPSPVVPGRVSPHVSYRAVRRNGRNHAVISSNGHLPQLPKAVPPGVRRGRAAFIPSLRYNLEPALGGSAGHRLGAIFICDSARSSASWGGGNEECG